MTNDNEDTGTDGVMCLRSSQTLTKGQWSCDLLSWAGNFLLKINFIHSVWNLVVVHVPSRNSGKGHYQPSLHHFMYIPSLEKPFEARDE